MASSSESLRLGNEFEAGSNRIPRKLIRVRDARVLGVLVPRETLFLDGEDHLAVANKGRRTFVVRAIDSQDQPPSFESHETTSSVTGNQRN